MAKKRLFVGGGIALVAIIAVAAGCSSSDTAEPKVATEPSQAAVKTPAPKPSVKPKNPFQTDYKNGLTVAVGKFKRATSSDTAYPTSAPEVKFTVTVKNGTKKNVDLSMFSIACAVDGKSSDEVSDVEDLTDTPSTHLLTGDTFSWETACTAPSNAGKLQVEVSPDGWDLSDSVFVKNLK